MKTFKHNPLLLSLAVSMFVTVAAHAQLAIHTIAGTGTASYTGDGGPATSATLNTPFGVAIGPHHSIYFTDAINNSIRKIDTFGTITTVAGTGTSGFSGDGGPATNAKLANPRGIAIDATGNVYFTDYGNNRIRKVSTAGTISTIAGDGFATFTGDGGPAVNAELNFPWGIAIDAAGNIFVADQLNNRIRKINTAGIISTIAGIGSASYSGDGGPATNARLQYPTGVAVDGTGNIYIADYGNNLVRKINTAGIISTIAGIWGPGSFGFTGDGGPSTAAHLYLPEGVATDAAGNVYIADVNNDRIRKIDASGVINTIAGNGMPTFGGDGGAPTLASLNQPTGITVDADNNVYITDNNNNRIRELEVIDGPYFTNGHKQYITFCATEAINIDTLLEVTDGDVGNSLSWQLAQAPVYGGVIYAYSATSDGGTIVPSALSYLMAAHNTTDTFKISVTDGRVSDTTTIYVTIENPVFSGSVTSNMDSICPGDTATFFNAVAGGTWSVNNTTISTISSSGIVTALEPGTVTVSYSVSNSCGTSSASRSLIVRSDCPTSVKTIGKNGGLSIFPNPGDGNFTVDLKSNRPQIATFVVTDVVGNIKRDFTTTVNGSIVLNLNEPPGIYFLSVTTAEGKWTDKIVIK